MIRFSFLKVMFVAFFLVMSMVLMRPATTFSQDATALSTAWAADASNAALNAEICFQNAIDQNSGDDDALTQSATDCALALANDFAGGAQVE